MGVCLAASATTCFYCVKTKIWSSNLGKNLIIPLVASSTLFLLLILAIPAFHNPFLGLFWTFIQLTVLAIVFYIPMLPSLGKKRFASLLSLRILALAALVPMLFEPILRQTTRPAPDRNLYLLIDSSGSMGFPDIQNGPTRFQSVQQVLTPLQKNIDEHFIPHYLHFDAKTAEIPGLKSLSKINPDGNSTDLVSAITTIAPKLDKPDSALVLITDGIDNVTPDVAHQLEKIGKPIYAVRVGSESAEPTGVSNIALSKLESDADFSVGQLSKLRATVLSTAISNRIVDVNLAPVDDQDKPTGQTISQRLVLKSVAEGQTVEFAYKPTAAGPLRLAVWVDPVPGERSTADNRQVFQTLAMESRIGVLYIEGRVRPEYRDLNRALSRDANIELATLLRVSTDQFKASGTVRGEEFSALPSELPGFQKFDVLILGDIDASFLAKPRLGLIEQFVSEGGGLLMLGGENTFAQGAYKDTPIEKAMPLYMGEENWPQEKTQFVPTLTADGLTHPALEGLSDWFPTPTKLKPAKELPALRGNVVLGKPKTGANVLLTHAQRPTPEGIPQPVLAVQRYGKGRSAALTIDTTYLWYTPLRAMGQDSPYNRFWGQLIRWLADADTRNRSRGAGVDGLLSQSVYDMGQDVHIRALVRDARGDATQYAQVSAVLVSPDGKSKQNYSFSADANHIGLYDLTLPAPDKGDWEIQLVANKDDQKLGEQKLHFTVIPPAQELVNLAANPKLLQGIATSTKGGYCELSQLSSMLDQIIRQKPVIGEQTHTLNLSNTFRAVLYFAHIRPNWPTKYDLPMQAFWVLSILTAEWTLRRKWRLN